MMTKEEENRQQETLTIAHHDYAKGLNSHASFKVNDSAIGEDLVQDTFLKTWKYLVKGGKIDIMKAFLYHILNNLIIDQYRKHKTVSLDIMVEKGFEPSDHDSDRFLDVLDGKAALPLIQRLPEKYRKVVYMRYIQVLSLKEISILIGQTRSTVAVQIHRGLGKMKLLYKTV